MDLSFANQSLASEHLIKNSDKLKKQVYDVPEEIDRYIAKLKLEAMGISIDQLTEEQIRYLNSWSEGTWRYTEAYLRIGRYNKTEGQFKIFGDGPLKRMKRSPFAVMYG